MKVFKFSSDGEDQKCGGCGWRVFNLYALGDDLAEAEQELWNEEAICGDCLCEVMADSGHTVESPTVALAKRVEATLTEAMKGKTYSNSKSHTLEGR